MSSLKKFLTFSLMIAILFSFCQINFVYSATKTPVLKIESNKPKTWQPELLVGLFTSNTPVKVQVNIASVIKNAERNNKIKSINKNSELVISSSADKMQVDGQPVNSNIIEIRPQNEADLKNMQTKINGIAYFGGVKIIKTNLGLSVINIVTVEEYLRCVLPKEVSPSWNMEALKAQAVAARTFALKNRKRHKQSGYDLCNNSHCQVYGGVNSANARTDEAVAKTFGEVLYYKDKMIEAPFHTDSGGMTENAVDVWGTDYPYLRAATEIETKTQSWIEKIALDKFTSTLAAANYKVGKVQFIKITNLEIGKLTNDRSTSGRVKEVAVIGDKGEVKISGIKLRSLFGLNSTLFEIGISDNEVVVKGYGRGHGVGMSQMGAQNFAEHGYTYDKILTHYYKNTSVKRLY